jgi:hypothetical protein
MRDMICSSQRTAFTPRHRNLVAIAMVALFAGCTDEGSTDRGSLIAPRHDVSGTAGTQVFVFAHQDDWQLFLGSHVAGHANATKLVFIYTTAGDAGRTAIQPDYWAVRETAANASVDSILPAGAWACASQVVNSHPIQRCTKANSVSYYMRLPDGNGEGQGYGLGSLTLLRDAGQALTAIDGSTTYTSWTDLSSTVNAVIALESNNQSAPNVAVHAPEYNRGINNGDHADHHATGDLVKGASGGQVWDLSWFVGYRTVDMPVNLSAEEQATAWKVFMAYDAVVFARFNETLVGNSHAEAWTQRAYSRSEVSTGAPTPPPAAPTNIIVNVNGPRITALNWTDNATDEAFYKIERAPDLNGVPGAFTQVGTTSSSGFWEHTDAVPGVKSWYRIRGFSYHAGDGPYSAPALSDNIFWDVYLTAHPDDWQLFFGNRAAQNMLNGAKVVVIFTTAGDAGSAVSLPAYWQARETASLAAFNSVTPAGPTTCAQQVVNGHPIKRCVKINAVSYFMRLPDGNGEGQGYGGRGSLEILRGGGAPLSAIDNSTSYVNWADVITTVQGIVDQETNNGRGSRLRVHGFEWDREFNSSDHSDHLASADLMKAAAGGHVWELSHYIGYQIGQMPANLSQDQIDLKMRVFLPYDSVMVQLMGETLIGTSSVEDWVRRTYFRDANSWGDPVQLPSAPTGLTATASTGTRIDLRWVDESANEDGFHVDRSPDEFGQPTGEWTQIASLEANRRTYANGGLPNGVRYWYRVRAFNFVGRSGYSDRAGATTLSMPAAPSDVVATPAGSERMDLTWTDNSTNESNFRIERAPDVNGAPGTFALVANVGANVTTYRTPANLTPSTAYWFRVRAYNAAFTTPFTSPITGTTTAFEAPSLLTANAYLVGTIRNVDLTWTTGSEPLVDIWRNTTKIKPNHLNGTPFNNKPANSLGASVNYYVCAAGKTGTANCSNTVTVTF